MRMMQAAVVRTFGQPLQIEEVPLPEASPGQLPAKVGAPAVRRTNLHAAAGGWPSRPNPPFTFGHGDAGDIVAPKQPPRRPLAAV